MSTPFLTGFASALVERLIQTEQLEIETGAEARVAAFVAAQLHAARDGAQLITTTGKALLAAPGVEELWADDDALKQTVQELQMGGR